MKYIKSIFEYMDPSIIDGNENLLKILKITSDINKFMSLNIKKSIENTDLVYIKYRDMITPQLIFKPNGNTIIYLFEWGNPSNDDILRSLNFLELGLNRKVSLGEFKIKYQIKLFKKDNDISIVNSFVDALKKGYSMVWIEDIDQNHLINIEYDLFDYINMINRTMRRVNK